MALRFALRAVKGGLRINNFALFNSINAAFTAYGQFIADELRLYLGLLPVLITTIGE